MAWYPARGGGIPASVKTDMNAVLNKKFGTVGETYPPKEWADDVNLMGLLPIRTASGAIAHFEDGADDVPCVSVVANIEPVQDLHGYANPWVGGAGSNKWDEQWELGGFNSVGEPIPADDRIRSVNFTPIQPNTSYYFKTTNTLGVRYYDANKNFISSANGTNTALTTPSNAYYLKVLILNTTTYGNDVAVNYPSSVTTYSPYANVCPISGTSVLNVTRCGKNLFDKNTSSNWVNWGILSGGVISENSAFKSAILRCSPNTLFTASKTLGARIGLASFTSYPTTSSIPSVYDFNNTGIQISITTGANDKYILVWFRNGNVDTATAQEIANTLQVEKGSVTTYEAYTDSTYTKALGQTVYGGTLDLVSGLLTIKKVKEVRRWDSARSSGSSVGDYWRKSFELANATIASTTNTECSVALYYAAYSSNTLHYYIDSSARLMLFLPNNTADSYEFEICYPLATPIEVQLTPEEVRTFLGVNNIWADTGDTEVEYRADIDLLLASLEGNRGLQMTRSTPPVEEEQTEEVEENEDER